MIVVLNANTIGGILGAVVCFFELIPTDGKPEIKLSIILPVQVYREILDYFSSNMLSPEKSRLESQLRV